jgi:hypothetical protein
MMSLKPVKRVGAAAAPSVAGEPLLALADECWLVVRFMISFLRLRAMTLVISSRSRADSVVDLASGQGGLRPLDVRGLAQGPQAKDHAQEGGARAVHRAAPIIEAVDDGAVRELEVPGVIIARAGDPLDREARFAKLGDDAFPVHSVSPQPVPEPRLSGDSSASSARLNKAIGQFVEAIFALDQGRRRGAIG